MRSSQIALTTHPPQTGQNHTAPVCQGTRPLKKVSRYKRDSRSRRTSPDLERLTTSIYWIFRVLKSEYNVPEGGERERFAKVAGQLGDKKKTPLKGSKVVNFIRVIWWRRGESTPRPETFHLGVYILSPIFQFRPKGRNWAWLPKG